MMRNFVYCLLAMTCAAAHAQWTPTQPVEIVIGTSAGSGSDRTGRLIQRLLQDKKLVPTSSFVSNKAGGGGTIALTYITQQAGSGHHLFVTSPTMLTNRITGRTTLSHADTTPLAQLGSEYVAFSVRADSPLKSAKDIADRLRADPAALSFSIGVAVGSHNHIAVAQVAKAVGSDVRKLRVVAFAGSADGIAAVLGGHIDVAAAPASGVMPHARAGKLRILVASADRRLSGALAGLPIWKDYGINAVASNWRSVAGPKGLSEAQVRYWDQVLGRLAQQAEWKHDLDTQHIENTYLNATATRKLMDAQMIELRGILGELGLAK